MAKFKKVDDTKVVRKVESPTAALVTKLIEEHKGGLNQQDIADKLGIESRGNIFSLFKTGRSKFPIKHIRGFCNILGVDPAPLYKTALAEYFPEVLDAMTSIESTVVDEDELALIRIWRNVKSKATEEMRAKAVDEIVKEAKERDAILTESLLRPARRLTTKLSRSEDNVENIREALRRAVIEV